jgi:hypothetical protein
MSYKKREDNVYQEWDKRIIKSNQGKNRYYRVFYGTVLWQDREIRKACVVFVQYGKTEDWKAACRNREIAFDEPAHILVEDIEKVYSAITEFVTPNHNGQL